MNVLFISHYSALYGANRSLLALLDGLDYKSIKPFVVAPQSGAIEIALEKRSIPFYICPFKNWMAPSRLKMPLRLLMNIVTIPVLLWKLKVWKIDLVYTNSSVTPIGAWCAYLAGLPHIWHIREFGWEDYGLKYDLGEKVFNYWLDRAEKLIAVSYAVCNKVLGNTRAKKIVVYNGVISKNEVPKLPPVSSNHRKSGNPFIFGIIGLLHPSKGQEDAIRAFAEVNALIDNIELWIAGSGSKEYENYLRNLCTHLNLNRKVKFLGYVDNPLQFFSEIDAALVCSGNEAMGRVTAEAMVAGKPIIGLDNAGTSELIEDEKNGLLYDGSVDSLASKIDRKSVV